LIPSAGKLYRSSFRKLVDKEVLFEMNTLIKTMFIALTCLALFGEGLAHAGGGPLGIDSRLSYDNSGIWARSNQRALLKAMIGVEIIGALWEGSETRLGKTFWQAIDSSVFAGAGATVMKPIFGRQRPNEGNDPDKWFQSSSYKSFPSGDVATVTAIVTPFVLEYGHTDPMIYGLEVLPLYDAIARMKVQAHWQTDVLAGFAIGTLAGYYAHSRKTPFFVSLLPGGVFAGISGKF
jgi:membrane-associated phospholipid phosphatase